MRALGAPTVPETPSSSEPSTSLKAAFRTAFPSWRTRPARRYARPARSKISPEVVAGGVGAGLVEVLVVGAGLVEVLVVGAVVLVAGVVAEGAGAVLAEVLVAGVVAEGAGAELAGVLVIRVVARTAGELEGVAATGGALTPSPTPGGRLRSECGRPAAAA